MRDLVDPPRVNDLLLEHRSAVDAVLADARAL